MAKLSRAKVVYASMALVYALRYILDVGSDVYLSVRYFLAAAASRVGEAEAEAESPGASSSSDALFGGLTAAFVGVPWLLLLLLGVWITRDPLFPKWISVASILGLFPVAMLADAVVDLWNDRGKSRPVHIH